MTSILAALASALTFGLIGLVIVWIWSRRQGRLFDQHIKRMEGITDEAMRDAAERPDRYLDARKITAGTIDISNLHSHDGEQFCGCDNPYREADDDEWLHADDRAGP